jgi:hypothetical protein
LDASIERQSLFLRDQWEAAGQASMGLIAADILLMADAALLGSVGGAAAGVAGAARAAGALVGAGAGTLSTMALLLLGPNPELPRIQIETGELLAQGPEAFSGLARVSARFVAAHDDVNRVYFEKVAGIRANARWYHLGQDELAEATLDAQVTSAHLYLNELERRFLRELLQGARSFCGAI